MTPHPSPKEIVIYDLIGIGLGPAQLSFLIACAEQSELAGWKMLHLERGASFSWHAGMRTAYSMIQMSYLKDLVTLRNPQSAFTYISFLHDQGRLQQAANLNDYTPSRFEYAQYLSWVLNKLAPNVRYSAEVTNLDKVCLPEHGEVLQVTYQDPQGRRSIEYTRNIYLAAGKTPFVPEHLQVAGGEQVWHTSHFSTALAHIRKHPAPRVAVVGSGQSAVEALLTLQDACPDLELHAISRGQLFRAVDANPYVNGFYTWESEQRFHQADQAWRGQVRAELSNSNYGVADVRLLNELARRDYDDRILGRQRLHRHSHCEILAIDEESCLLTVTLQDRQIGGRRVLNVDFIVFATGYHSDNIRDLTAPVESCVATPGQQLTPHPAAACHILIAGQNGPSSGLAEETITSLALRAGAHVSLLLHLNAHRLSPGPGVQRRPSEEAHPTGQVLVPS
ncbi:MULTISPECIES: SidA/IucD/PvdA family monooxygenase [unclassified Deinococcus]|uniref:SidA/IucD/PvdA family monooxygenase n=1 Tax=unclassified Deinococcus TaxID=2623546 RepID=UPI0009945E55|nr:MULTISPECIES: SidA/IucD/PvdA family monooxygenase [unclassified Deinococcus]MBX8465819.1 lysine N(6)-hydroxylase/L-ornithine N(5)-oxygenase family protein [Deinococcus sp. RIT780]NTX99131.1 hypothetical protein [Deinococcus sp. JMULE3]OOV12098.1 hypothetical protein BXU09_17420 [Deinococcus sp. LM3]OOV12274.1 hypothetical protein BXU09_18445 [Deinococcus sp. LM3]